MTDGLFWEKSLRVACTEELGSFFMCDVLVQVSQFFYSDNNSCLRGADPYSLNNEATSVCLMGIMHRFDICLQLL